MYTPAKLAILLTRLVFRKASGQAPYNHFKIVIHFQTETFVSVFNSILQYFLTFVLELFFRKVFMILIFVILITNGVHDILMYFHLRIKSGWNTLNYVQQWFNLENTTTSVAERRGIDSRFLMADAEKSALHFFHLVQMSQARLCK